MKRNGFLEIFYPYIVNENTMEAHRVKNITSKCRVGLMRNGRYCSARKVRKLLAAGYNGCRWCWKEKDKG